MLFKRIFTCLVVFQSVAGFACDGCNIYTGMNAYNTENKISIYTRQRTTFGEFSALGEMIMKHTGHANDKNLWDRSVIERYQTVEIRGDFYFKEKWKTTIILPFTNNYQFLDSEKRFRISGISDPVILETRNFYLDKKNGLNQKIGVGLGLKLPLGLTNVNVEGFRPNLDFQPGSGAYSGIGYVDYYISNKTWGGFANVNYKLNGRNQDNYRYGYSLNSKITGFWKTNVKKVSFILMTGIYTEFTGFDESDVVHEDTGGQIIFGNLEWRVGYKQLMLSAEYQPVLCQNMYGNTQLLTRDRINIGLTYNIKK